MGRCPQNGHELSRPWFPLQYLSLSHGEPTPQGTNTRKLTSSASEEYHSQQQLLFSSLYLNFLHFFTPNKYQDTFQGQNAQSQCQEPEDQCPTPGSRRVERRRARSSGTSRDRCGHCGAHTCVSGFAPSPRLLLQVSLGSGLGQMLLCLGSGPNVLDTVWAAHSRGSLTTPVSLPAHRDTYPGSRRAAGPAPGGAAGAARAAASWSPDSPRSSRAVWGGKGAREASHPILPGCPSPTPAPSLTTSSMKPQKHQKASTSF